jgi:hypothetical protein
MGMRKEQDIRKQQLSGDEARSPEDGMMIDLASTMRHKSVDEHHLDRKSHKMNQIMTTEDPSAYSRRMLLAAAGPVPKAVIRVAGEPELPTEDGWRLREGNVKPVGPGEDQ